MQQLVGDLEPIKAPGPATEGDPANLGAAFLRPFGYLIAGWAASTVGPQNTFAGSAVVLTSSIALVTAMLLPIRRQLRSSTRPAPTGRAAAS